ncbi:MAG TPA: hypothetical protein VM328_13050 [Fimbriimonadaceae bacterium]|nr:hypothetical protein [Fimbriimonadaceae bacterium]
MRAVGVNRDRHVAARARAALGTGLLPRLPQLVGRHGAGDPARCRLEATARAGGELVQVRHETFRPIPDRLNLSLGGIGDAMHLLGELLDLLRDAMHGVGDRRHLA